MSNCNIRLSVVFLTLFCCVVVSNGLSNSSGKGGMGGQLSAKSNKMVYNGLGYANGDHNMKMVSGGKPKGAKPQRGGLGLSAWGIIAVLTAAVLATTGAYYAILFYPILCKKERKNNLDKTLDCCPSAPPASDSPPAMTPPAVSTPV